MEKTRIFIQRRMEAGRVKLLFIHQQVNELKTPAKIVLQDTE